MENGASQGRRFNLLRLSTVRPPAYPSLTHRTTSLKLAFFP